MSTNHHTPWSDGVSEYKAAHMNTPLGELDQVISDVSGEVINLSGEFGSHAHVYTDITGRPADDNMNGLTPESANDGSDNILIYDDTAGAYRKQSRTDFLAGVGATSGEFPYDVGMTYAGVPTDGLVVLRLPMSRTVDFDWGGGVSQAVAGVAATAESIFTLEKDGVEKGTCTFAISGTVGTFSGETQFVTGEVLTLTCPGTADDTLADLGFVLAGIR
jgi:hypothetical protein